MTHRKRLQRLRQYQCNILLEYVTNRERLQRLRQYQCNILLEYVTNRKRLQRLRRYQCNISLEYATCNVCDKSLQNHTPLLYTCGSASKCILYGWFSAMHIAVFITPILCTALAIILPTTCYLSANRLVKSLYNTE